MQVDTAALADMAATFYTMNYGRQETYTYIDPFAIETAPVVDPLDNF